MPQIARNTTGDSEGPLTTYPHAPITEAVLDIRARLSSKSELPKLEAIRDDAYPILRNPFQFNIRLESSSVDQPGTPSISHNVQSFGFGYLSTDKKQVFQVRKDGFSHNRLAPYHSWAEFKAEAKRLWEIYGEKARPEFIELLGVTYINQLRVPPGVRLEDYFKTYIQVPLELPQQLTSMSFSFGVESVDLDAKLNVSQVGGLPTEDGRNTIILTIQAYKEVNKKLSELSESNIWSIFDRLRLAKNDVFEACITDKMREDFH